MRGEMTANACSSYKYSVRNGGALPRRCVDEYLALAWQLLTALLAVLSRHGAAGCCNVFGLLCGSDYWAGM